ncbi:hypothetical protein KJ940_04580, partial [Myxococcota bacterium]|nr:hypothetical protein [Myxococcota bacterium]
EADAGGAAGEGGCTPREEICDGADNDCDGLIDEDIAPQICDMGGVSGRQTCEDDGWSACVATGPMPEDCNGLDDDGDGQIDEDLSRACNTACGSGLQRCEQIEGVPTWVGCTARPPEPEACNGIDDDCDGIIDEHLDRPCQDPRCGTEGEESCVLGQWTLCSALGPAVEVCNGVDDDCDGEIDDGLSQPCQTLCGEGQRACVNGSFEQSPCVGRQPEPEICGNQLDDDCNGLIDDGCTDCMPGELVECSTPIGACTPGQSRCDEAGAWGDCLDGDGAPVRLPGDEREVCDGVDNDCDGFIDEDDPTLGDPCGLDVGQCEAGRVACEGGLIICAGATEGSSEICDEVDNDCDGEVDEGLEPDVFEPNEGCATAEDLGELAENNEPRRLVASLYPEGDADVYFFRAVEASNACVPGIFPDDAFEVTIAFTPPEGAGHQICITVFKQRDDPLICAGEEVEILEPRACSGAGETRHLSLARCGFNDTMDFLIEIEADAPSCQPYTLSFASATLIEPED